MSCQNTCAVPLAWVVLAVTTLAFALPRIDDLGLYYDEAFLAQQARGFVEPDRAGVHPASVASFWIAGRPFPIRNAAYLGSLKSQLLIPSFWLFGSSSFVLRVSTLVTGLLGLLFSMLFARRLFGNPVAVVGGVLLASDPSFFFFSQFEWGPFTSMLVCRAAGLYFLNIAFTPAAMRANWFAAIASGICLGLGIYSRVDFAVILAALALAMLACRRDVITAVWRDHRAKLLAASVVFLLAASPAIRVAGEIMNAGSALVGRGDFDYRVDVLASVFDGSHFFRLIRAGGLFPDLFGQEAPKSGFILVLCISAIVLLLPTIRASKRQQPSSERFLVLTTLLIGVFMLLLPVAVRAHHMLNLLPFPHLIVALAGVGLWRRSWARPQVRLFARSSVAISLVALLASNADILVQTRELIHDTRGKGRFSRSLQDFAKQIDQAPDAENIELVSLDWGFHEPLLFATEHVKLSEPIWRLTKPGLRRTPYLVKGDRNTIYLIHEAPYDLFGLGAPFRTALRKIDPEDYAILEHRDGTGDLAFKSVRFKRPHQLRFDGRFHFRLRGTEFSHSATLNLR